MIETLYVYLIIIPLMLAYAKNSVEYEHAVIVTKTYTHVRAKETRHSEF